MIVKINDRNSKVKLVGLFKINKPMRMMTKFCLQCRKLLTGRQSKYCSRQCKNIFLNQSLQSYEAQQERGRKRKLELIKLKGNQCETCGYNNNYSALEFHHREPVDKNFQLDLRSLSNIKWEVILNEVEKCQLLCSNCHAEHHNPDCKL